MGGTLVSMNSKHRKTLAAVFTDPVSGTIRMGGNRKPAAGRRGAADRMGRVYGSRRMAKDAKRYQVRDARDLLARIGVRP